VLLTTRRSSREWAAEIGMNKLQDVINPMSAGRVRVARVLCNYARFTPIQDRAHHNNTSTHKRQLIYSITTRMTKTGMPKITS